jgi:M6 family metalloprotease-like protein
VVLDARGFDFTAFDTNGDQVIDSITFLHSGYGAEFGGVDVFGTNYTNRIWSHKNYLGSSYGLYDGIKFEQFHISPAVWGKSGSAIGRIGVIALETGHFLGITDLYDTDGDGNGIGSWGLMGNCWGFDFSQYFPPHMCSWSKIQMGWLTPVEAKYGINQISAGDSGKQSILPQ